MVNGATTETDIKLLESFMSEAVEQYILFIIYSACVVLLQPPGVIIRYLAGWDEYDALIGCGVDDNVFFLVHDSPSCVVKHQFGEHLELLKLEPVGNVAEASVSELFEDLFTDVAVVKGDE